MNLFLVAFLVFLAIFLGKKIKANFFDLRSFPGPSPWLSFPIIGKYNNP